MFREILALLWVAAFGFALLVTYFLVADRSPREALRRIPFFDALVGALALAMEAGWGVHQGLGAGRLWGDEGAAGFAGLTALEGMGRMALRGDHPPQSSAGGGLLTLLAFNRWRMLYRSAARVPDVFPFQIPGMLPWGYTAGVLAFGEGNTEQAGFIGHYGAEAGLLTESAPRVLAASEDPSTQALLYAVADHTLVGEEVFASGAYLENGPSHIASLIVQDVFRILVLLALLAAPLVALLGGGG